MPLLSSPRTPITVRLRNRQIGQTTVMQEARFVSLFHEQINDGECSVTIRVEVNLYAQTDTDELGERLMGNGFSNYFQELYAKNDTLVDAQTGEILLTYSADKQQQWLDLLASDRPTMLQGDFFEMLRENAPIEIGDLIRQHIVAADAMGRFA